MPRLANRGTTDRAPQTAAAYPPFPNFDPQLAEIDGGATNAAVQRWNSQMRSRLEGNAQQDNGRFRNIQTTVDRQDGYLESVWTMEAVAGPVVTGMTLFSSIDPEHNTTVSRITFQADVFQIQTASGNHKEVFSTSADAIKLGDVLTVDLVNAKVYIGTGTYGNANTAFYVDDDGYFSLKSKLTFDPSGAGTLTITGTIVATAGSIGGWDINTTTISKNNAVLDSAGQLVLGTSNDVVYISATNTTYRLWAGNATAGSAAFSVTKAGVLSASGATISGTITATSGTIGGWTLSSTTLSKNNAILDSAGQLVLGTSNDVIYISATDATYRIWAGNATAGSASFSVTKTGDLFSDSGTIGGFTIGGASLSATNLLIDTSGIVTIGPTSGAQAIALTTSTIHISKSNGVTVIAALENDGSDNGYIVLRTSGGSDAITLDGSTGTVTATLFSGSGASLTSLNASNISSGTLSNSRLPSAISVTTVQASSYIRLSDGTVGTPGVNFASDTDTGFRWNSSGDFRAVTNGADRLAIRDGAIVCLVRLKLDNSRVGGAPVAGGTILIQDSTGVDQQVLGV